MRKKQQMAAKSLFLIVGLIFRMFIRKPNGYGSKEVILAPLEDFCVHIYYKSQLSLTSITLYSIAQHKQTAPFQLWKFLSKG